MGGVELSNLVHLLHVVRPHLDDLLVLLVLGHVRALNAIMVVALSDVLFKHLHGHQIEDGYHVCGVVLQLLVKRLVELQNVGAIDIQGVLFSLSDLLQQSDVVGLLVHVHVLAILPIQVLVFVRDDGESCQEVLQLSLQVVGVDVGTPQNLSV